MGSSQYSLSCSSFLTDRKVQKLANKDNPLPNYENHPSSTEWIVDSGATMHLQGAKTDLVRNSTSSSHSVKVYGGRKLQCTKLGSVPLTDSFILQNVSRVPNGNVNLLSVSSICSSGHTVAFTSSNCLIYPPHSFTPPTHIPHIAAARRGNLYILPSSFNNHSALHTLTTDVPSILHRRFGHMHSQRLVNLHKNTDIAESDRKVLKLRSLSSTLPTCTSCLFCKLQRPSIGKKHIDPHPHLLDCVYSDIKEFPISDNGTRYFISFIDSHSRFTHIVLLKSKSDAFAAIQLYFSFCRSQHLQHPRIFFTDNAPDLVAGAVPSFLASMECQQARCEPHTPEHNGVAERKNRTLDECARTLLHNAQLPLTFYPLAVQHACHLQNLWPHDSLKQRIPAAIWFQRPITLSSLRTFGCDAYCHLIPQHQQLTRAQLGVYVGHEHVNNCAKIYMPISGRIWHVRNPTLIESSFTRPLDSTMFLSSGEFDDTSAPPLFHPIPTGSLTSPIKTAEATPSSSLPELPMVVPPPPTPLPHQRHASVVAKGRISAIADYENNNTSPITVRSPVSISSFSSPPPAAMSNTPNVAPSSSSSSTLPSSSLLSTRTIQTPPQPEVPIASSSSSISAATPTVTAPTSNSTSSLISSPSVPELRRSTRHAGPPSRYSDGYAGIVQLDKLTCIVPSHLQDYESAIKNEWNSLLKKKVFIMFLRPHGTRILKSKWVLKLKLDGTRKARLTAKGFMQQYLVNYNETFSPVVNSITVRTVIAIAATLRLQLYQIDIKTAFLNAPLNENIYMEIPEHISGCNSQYVLKLSKSLYGLKQAPREWHITLSDKLKSLGYIQTQNDPCLFYKVKGSSLTILPVHVDDIKIASNSSTEVLSLQQSLQESFEISIITNNKYLGIDIVDTTDAILLSQHDFLHDLLSEHGLLECRTVSTPLTLDVLPNAVDNPDPQLQAQYRSIVGSLLYLANSTRPDISHATSMLSRYMHGPSSPHLTAATHVLRYLSGTQHLCLKYKKGGDITLKSHSDANWSDPQDGRSQSGFIIYLNDCPVAWSSSRQPVPALSTCEAEVIALTLAAQNILWLRNLLFELRFPQLSPTIIFCDNQASIHLAKNPNSSSRTKHINVRFHFLQYHVNAQDIIIKYESTSENTADIFTKSLQRVKHSLHTSSFLSNREERQDLRLLTY